jgi:ABC-type polysaccharide/polyol phosphate transport system ATPase subunit
MDDMRQYKAHIRQFNPSAENPSAKNHINSMMLLITNIGDNIWYAYDKENPVQIGYRYLDNGKLIEGIRTKLPYNLLPGESINIKANFVVHARTDSVTLIWDMVIESKAWFQDFGSDILTIEVNMNDASKLQQNKINEANAITCRNLSKKFKIYPKKSTKIKEFLSLGLKKKHEDYWALKDISFEVKKGETFGIIGFNGSGKSTLLSILAQTKHPTQGEFIVSGRIAALLELGAGFHPELSGRENVLYNSYLYGIPSHEIEKKINSIQEFAGIGEFFERPVRSYSSGMYVRLAFALAIHVDPDVLIIDEALAVGDEVFQRKCYSKFEEFKALGKTIILVTHDLNAVRALCDRVAVIYDGNLVFEGNSNEVVNYYQKMSLTANLQVVATHELEKDELRYGNGKAKIVEYATLDELGNESTVFSTGGKIKIRLRVDFYDQVKCPVFGLIFKTINGVELFGTNSKLLGSIPVQAHSGDAVTCEMDIPMYLNEGTYFISFGVSDQSDGETITVDRMIDVTFIRVVSDIPCIGLVNLNYGAGVKVNVN